MCKSSSNISVPCFTALKYKRLKLEYSIQIYNSEMKTANSQQGKYKYLKLFNNILSKGQKEHLKAN